MQGGFQPLFKLCQVIPKGLLEDGESRVRHQRVLVLPSLIIHQVILKTAKAHAVSAKNITGFKTIAEETIDQKLIAIRQETSVSVRIRCIQIPLGGIGYTTVWKRLWRILAERSSLAKGVLQKVNRFGQWSVS